MKIVLLLHVLFEGLVGLVFLFAPAAAVSFMPLGEPWVVYLLKMFGLAALTMAIYGFLVFLKFHEQEVLTTGLLVLTLFHIFIFIPQVYQSPASQQTLAPGIIHGVFGLLFLIFYIRER